MTERLDDRTTAYILATRRPFEDIRQVASQLAGLLVLAASGAQRATADEPMLAGARGLFDRAAAELRGARPGLRARAHHSCLLQAVTLIDTALSLASAGVSERQRGDIDSILAPLKAGYGQLQEAANQLPGFELVALGQGCCSVGHVGLAGQAGQVGPAGQVSPVGAGGPGRAGGTGGARPTSR